MRVLLTGSDGFLGRSVFNRLSESEYDLIAISRRNDTPKEKIYCDLRDVKKLSSILEDVKPDVIINLAASVDFNEGVLNKLFDVNVFLPSLFAKYCSESGAQLIHSSSTIIHGFQNSKFSITTAISPDTDYGKSKLLGDNNINASGCKAAIIRFGGIFGNDGPNHLGINKAINDAKLGIQPKLVGEGKALRNYIFVEDAAKAIMTCIDDRLHGVFYAGGGEKLSIKSMLEYIREEFIPDKEIEVVPGNEGKDQIVEPRLEFKSFSTFRQAIQKSRF